jgi:hypothetical protein
VADKLTQQIVEALGKAAAEPLGLPLFAAKSEPGLFATGAKAAAQKCLFDKLLHIVRTDTKGKNPRDLYAPTDAGWEYLLAAVNPKQVLEDFVRVLEERRGEVGELLVTARQMADSLQGLKDAVCRVLPQISLNRIQTAPPSDRLDSQRIGPSSDDLAEVVLERLTEWTETANAGEDCPLPDLFCQVQRREPQASLGEFHDCLRSLHSRGEIYLHPWTGPLYELPDPSSALLAGHGVAYYASLRATPKGSAARSHDAGRTLVGS